MQSLVSRPVEVVMMDAAVKYTFPITNSSRKIHFYLIFVVATILIQACTCAGAESNQPNEKTAEIIEAVGNEYDTPTQFALLQSIPFENQQDHINEFKRHLGALAAISGGRKFAGSKSFTPPSKKHVGSIAAGGYHQLRPGSMQREVLKRHLGALMAFKSRPLTRSANAGSLSEYQADSAPIENAIGLPYGGDLPLPYADESSLVSPLEADYRHTASDLDDTMDFDRSDDADESTPPKPKRFLGSLARGNWFPRNFRGFNKRHIGSLARLGWMPHAKATSRLGMAMEDNRGELGLKRNYDLASSRRRMLYHFTAPSLWTSPRGK